jgi:protein involved in temperature-dependent protein secretion
VIRQLFRNAGIKVSDQEFKEILYMATDDIRENRIKFGKRTSLQQVVTIAKRSLKALRQCDTALRLYFDRKVGV